MVSIRIDVDDREALDGLGELVARGANLYPALDAIGAAMVTSTQVRFERETGPDGQKWRPSKRAQKQGGQTLQDSRRLFQSITHRATAGEVEIGTNVIYAAIHQFGGTIQRAAYSKQVRHRTDAKGNLLRTNLQGKGLVFAKDAHKRALARWFEVGAHGINMPARPFLGFDASDRQEALAIIADHLAGRS